MINNFMIFVFLHFFVSDSGLYSISIQKVDGGQIQMSAFRGREIIIFEFGPGSADSSELRAMESIQVSNPSLAIIAVPAVEFSDSSGIAQLAQQTNSGFSYLMTQPMRVQKRAGDTQNDLFKWLTHVDLNTHFDVDVETEGQAYFINKKGVLFAVMGKLTSSKDIEKILQE